VIVPLALLIDPVDKYLLGDQGVLMGIAEVLTFLLYIRFALLVLPFLCLRSLPPDAFHVVHWASFIPHV